MNRLLIFILLFLAMIVACTGNKVDEAMIKKANQFFPNKLDKNFFSMDERDRAMVHFKTNMVGPQNTCLV